MPAQLAPACHLSQSLQSNSSRIVDEAHRRLIESPYFALRNLRCDYREGVLTVRGRVPTFYARQVALQTLRKVDAVEQLVDRIEVE